MLLNLFQNDDDQSVLLRIIISRLHDGTSISHLTKPENNNLRVEGGGLNIPTLKTAVRMFSFGVKLLIRHYC
jgi:hypothetical protein